MSGCTHASRRTSCSCSLRAAHATLAVDATVWQGAVVGRPGLALAQWCQQTASARCSGTTGCSFEVHGKSCCSDLLPHGLQLQSARRWPASRWKAGNTGDSQAMCAGQRSDYAAASAASAALSSAAAPRATVQPPPSQLQLNKQLGLPNQQLDEAAIDQAQPAMVSVPERQCSWLQCVWELYIRMWTSA